MSKVMYKKKWIFVCWGLKDSLDRWTGVRRIWQGDILCGRILAGFYPKIQPLNVDPVSISEYFNVFIEMCSAVEGVQQTNIHLYTVDYGYLSDKKI